MVAEKGCTPDDVANDSAEQSHCVEQVPHRMSELTVACQNSTVSLVSSRDAEKNSTFVDTKQDSSSGERLEQKQPASAKKQDDSCDNHNQHLTSASSCCGEFNVVTERLSSDVDPASDSDSELKRLRTVSYSHCDENDTLPGSKDSICEKHPADISGTMPDSEPGICDDVSAVFGISASCNELGRKGELCGSLLHICHSCPTIQANAYDAPVRNNLVQN